jgi:hypothetical protein
MSKTTTKQNKTPKVGDCIVIEEEMEAKILSVNDDGTVTTNLVTPCFREATSHHERSDNGDLKIEMPISGGELLSVCARQSRDGGWTFDWDATYAQADDESDEDGAELCTVCGDPVDMSLSGPDCRCQYCDAAFCNCECENQHECEVDE